MIMLHWQYLEVTVDRKEFVAWLLADVPYLQANNRNFNFLYPQIDHNPTPILHVLIRNPTPTVFYITGYPMLDEDENIPPRFYGIAVMVTQDIFCSLERRGLKMIYIRGMMNWQE